MKQFKNILAIVLLVFSSSMLFAQQDAHASLYKYNMNIINPAYAGTNGYTELTTNFRSQWINLPDSPETQAISLGMPVNDKIGVGLSIVNDRVFVLRETDIYADFSYNLQVSDASNLYLGLKAGGSFINIDLNRPSTPVNNDPLFTENISKFNPNVGIGAYYKTDKYYVSLSAPALLKSKRYEKESVVVTDATDKTHFYAGAGYEFNLNENIDFQPSVLARFVSGAPISLDLSGTFDLYDRVELGVTYRLSESISGMALFKLADWFDLGYAYEHTTTEIGDYNDGTHEVVIRFNLGREQMSE